MSYGFSLTVAASTLHPPPPTSLPSLFPFNDLLPFLLVPPIFCLLLGHIVPPLIRLTPEVQFLT